MAVDLPLASGELAWMRSTVSTYLAGTAIIQTYSSATDSQGGYTDTFTASATVSARLAPIHDGAEANVAGREAETARYMLTVPSTTTIDERDRVSYNSVVYEVVEFEDRTPWHLDHRVVVIRVD